ncbi:hypothetical protein TNCV_2377241 [Trichonephila clavipes]|nr:hypothetical protein TNCV_2377241 [Trichonephila clavipes]
MSGLWWVHKRVCDFCLGIVANRLEWLESLYVGPPIRRLIVMLPTQGDSELEFEAFVEGNLKGDDQLAGDVKMTSLEDHFPDKSKGFEQILDTLQ